MIGVAVYECLVLLLWCCTDANLGFNFSFSSFTTILKPLLLCLGSGAGTPSSDIVRNPLNLFVVITLRTSITTASVVYDSIQESDYILTEYTLYSRRRRHGKYQHHHHHRQYVIIVIIMLSLSYHYVISMLSVLSFCYLYVIIMSSFCYHCYLYVIIMLSLCYHCYQYVIIMLSEG